MKKIHQYEILDFVFYNSRLNGHTQFS